MDHLFAVPCRRWVAGAACILLAGCAGREGGATPADSTGAAPPAGATAGATTGAAAADQPDGPPRMANPEPPFRYPAALYARKVQGNVTLRLWIDSTGRVRPDSTRVAEPSGYPALDSAAVAGSERLTFRPAIREGRPAGAAILFPVYFRHPEASPLPGDSVLRGQRPTP